jgi:hypothetical protein
MTFGETEVKDGGIWISKSELEKKFKLYRELGYGNDSIFRTTGSAVLQLRSIEYHAKADVFYDLLQLIINDEEERRNG